MSKQRHLVRVRGRPPTEFANTPEVSDADAAALPSATGREEGLAEDETLSDFEAEVLSHEGGGRPMSEVTANPDPGRPEETEDGLDEVEEALRRAAEDPVSGREKL
ncbi:MAG: hypothetical protein QOJ96_633 [Alphaproteobacteria bacterium]|jgi:hypothetical protein|nr:hypothetical protein [Alphaproteobacteria bacterium]